MGLWTKLRSDFGDWGLGIGIGHWDWGVGLGIGDWDWGLEIRIVNWDLDWD